MSNKHFIYPTSLKKKLKACSRCHLIKTEEQFNKEGCENSDYEKREALQYITSHFKGMIAIMDTKYSWAARWLNLSKKLLIYIFLYNIFFNILYIFIIYL